MRRDAGTSDCPCGRRFAWQLDHGPDLAVTEVPDGRGPFGECCIASIERIAGEVADRLALQPGDALPVTVRRPAIVAMA